MLPADHPRGTTLRCKATSSKRGIIDGELEQLRQRAQDVQRYDTNCSAVAVLQETLGHENSPRYAEKSE